jgi:deoxyadenosine/deoxycytidine kinase
MLFSIEGNIGAGKSTIINHLKEFTTHINGTEVIYIPEPVDEWESIVSTSGQSMIELFYKDPAKYAFSFQMMAYISRLYMIQTEMEKNPNAIFITERCLLSDYHVFAQMLFESGHLSLEEFSIYKKWFHYFNTIHVTGFIYVKCSPKTAHDRCISRNRPGETISYDYIVDCDDKHTQWIQEVNLSTPVLILDNDFINIDEAMFEIEDFIKDELEDDFNLNERIDPQWLAVYNGYISIIGASLCYLVFCVTMNYV